MIDFLESKLSEFKTCFSRTASYKWFVIVIIGLLTRGDKLGVTSFVRSLSLKEKCYECLIHFFRSTAYCVNEIKEVWISIVGRSDKLFRMDGRVLLLGDGTKVAKEGKKMPGVQKQYQESENISKSPYIFGHMFGGLAAIIGNPGAYFAVPISMEIHQGISVIADWNESFSDRKKSHVVRMIENGYEAAQILGRSILCLDRYFLTVPSLKRLAELNAEVKLLDIITRAKSNCIAYEKPEPVTEKRRGRPRKRGNAVKLKTLFETRKEDFIKAKARMYGAEEEVSYLCLDLLWGVGLYRELRFVLVDCNRGKGIFVCTDTSLDPVKIIEGYSMRFGIECSFRELKQQIGAFCYHFWTSCLPKLNRFKKKDEAGNLAKVTDEKNRDTILATIDATERFVLFSCIAIGLTQMIALEKSLSENISKHRYLRTKARIKISEATVLEYMRKHLFRLLLLHPDSEITRIILPVMKPDSETQNAEFGEKAA